VLLRQSFMTAPISREIAKGYRLGRKKIWNVIRHHDKFREQCRILNVDELFEYAKRG